MARAHSPKSPTLPKERAAQLVSESDCKAPGETDEDICKRFGVSTKTLERWRKRLAADPEWSSVVERKKLEASKGWEQERLRFLRDSIRKMGKLVQEATVADLRQVAGAIKIVGDLHSLSRALGTDQDDVEQPGGAGKGPRAATPAGRDGGAPSATPDSPVH